MAAGRSRPDISDFTREDVDRLTDALKDEEFRKLLFEYCEEVNSPESRAQFQKEVTQVERERGYLVSFVSPRPGYVLKTSQDGDKKTFINVCSSEVTAKPQYWRVAGGFDWRIPFALPPPKEDYDKAKKRCTVYDVAFHPNALLLASKSARFKKMLSSTACDAVQDEYRVKLDLANVKQPKLAYKGAIVPAVVRRPDPEYEEDAVKEPRLLDELYPQIVHQHSERPERATKIEIHASGDTSQQQYAVPKYIVKQRRDIDIQEFTYETDSKRHSAIPKFLVVEVNLPLLSTTADVDLKVEKKSFHLVSETPARYKLLITLPYNVNSDTGSAKFDLKERLLIVTLPVIPEKIDIPWRVREDSGVESDINSPCNSDEDYSAACSLVTELSDSPGIEVISECEAYRTSAPKENKFLDPDLSYVLPSFICNVFDNFLVLTLDVKNVDSDSLLMEEFPDTDGAYLKFNSIGAGFFSIYYALVFKLPSGSKCKRPIPEVWDNNVVLQIEICETNEMNHFFIGSENIMQKYDLETPIRIQINSESTSTNHIVQSEDFVSLDLDYSFPKYTLNVLDNILAFTFRVENIKTDSFSKQYSSDYHQLKVKFSSVCDDKSLCHYLLCLRFPNGFSSKECSFDINPNNAIMRIEINNSSVPDHLFIGLYESDLKKEPIDVTDQLFDEDIVDDLLETAIEVTAKGINEMSISLHKEHNDVISKKESKNKSIPKENVENFDSICSSGSSFKGILKCKSHLFERSLSESNVDLVDCNVSPSYLSSDCIPEESSSLKKTVRFSDIITKQTFRTNSSILGQKTKNQRKKRNKKRALERRLSEGDPSDFCSLETDSSEDVFLRKEDFIKKNSGLLDTDDADSDKGENENSDTSIKNNNKILKDLSNHSKASNKGKYPEINFKNDLIFDLDL